MVEGAALEKQYAGNGIEGSNPSLSARIFITSANHTPNAKSLGVVAADSANHRAGNISAPD